MARPAPYSYYDAGYNGFFRRTLSSAPESQVLASRGKSQVMNYEDMQSSGALGDKLRIGRVIINGKDGRIEVEDELGNQVIWLGNVDV